MKETMYDFIFSKAWGEDWMGAKELSPVVGIKLEIKTPNNNPARRKNAYEMYNENGYDDVVLTFVAGEMCALMPVNNPDFDMKKVTLDIGTIDHKWSDNYYEEHISIGVRWREDGSWDEAKAHEDQDFAIWVHHPLAPVMPQDIKERLLL